MRSTFDVHRFLTDFVFHGCRLGSHPVAVASFWRLVGEDRLAFCGSSSPAVERMLPATAYYRLGEGLTGWVGLHGQALVLRDVDASRRASGPPFGAWHAQDTPTPGPAPCASWIGVPVPSKSSVLGVLRVVGAVPAAFEQSDVGAAQLLGRLCLHVTAGPGRPIRAGPEGFLGLANALRQARLSLGRTQQSVAEAIGRTRITLSRWEGGAQPPSARPLYEWCQHLGIVMPRNPLIATITEISPSFLRFLKQDSARLRSLSPEQFECFVAERLHRMGFDVTRTGRASAPDGGLDLVASRHVPGAGPFLLAVQVKHHAGGRRTGRAAVDRLLAWRDREFRIGLVVTNTEFTRHARWLAQQERNRAFLRLRDFEDLKRWLEDNFWSEEDWIQIPDEIEIAPGYRVAIPKPRLPNWREVWPGADVEIGHFGEPGR